MRSLNLGLLRNRAVVAVVTLMAGCAGLASVAIVATDQASAQRNTDVVATSGACPGPSSIASSQLGLPSGMRMVAQADHHVSQAVHGSAGTLGCAPWKWPIETSDGTERRQLQRPAEIPERKWQPGHRGVDLSVGPGDRLVSPTDAIVKFAGKVAGKDVVSLQTASYAIVSFEPARTDVPVGGQLQRGGTLGTAEGVSDHCGDHCVHVGVRIGTHYADPLLFLIGRSIRLKPVSTQ